MDEPSRRIRWSELYCETELYRAALRVYTKPLFLWRRALSASTDEQTLYDFARHGLRNLEAVHRSLQEERFHFRPGLALDRNWNGKRRTLYVYPWEERIVDLLLYRLLNRRLQAWFSPHSYAYRSRSFGLDPCQRKIAQALKAAGDARVYVVKRDIADYFATMDHTALLARLAELVEPGDYLDCLLQQRVRFAYERGGAVLHADRGIPFGAAIACIFANIYLNDMDRAVGSVPELHYFRYADDLLAFSPRREPALRAAAVMDDELARLHLASKPSHHHQLLFAPHATAEVDACFLPATKFRHLGLEFRAGGPVGLSRDKFRKILNLFRSTFCRHARKFRQLKDPIKRAQLAITLARKVLEQGVRNVAIVDYYLRHVEDERQLRLLDRWLAEEVLHRALGGGHKRGHFRLLSFRELRSLGLPSLVHRRRLIRHGHLESPFFVWKQRQSVRASKGTAARPRATAAFSSLPEAAAIKAS